MCPPSPAHLKLCQPHGAFAMRSRPSFRGLNGCSKGINGWRVLEPSKRGNHQHLDRYFGIDISWYFPLLGSPSIYILGSHIHQSRWQHTLGETKKPCWCCVSDEDEAGGLICTVIWRPSYWLQWLKKSLTFQDQVCPKMKTPNVWVLLPKSWNRSCGCDRNHQLPWNSWVSMLQKQVI